MKFIIFSIVFFVLSISTSTAQIIQGNARIIDGDTIEVAGRKIRLYGIDAPELGQNCKGVNGAIWDCGKVVSNQIRPFIGRYIVTCLPNGQDVFQRIVAKCHTAKVDLNASMVCGISTPADPPSYSFLPVKAASNTGILMRGEMIRYFFIQVKAKQGIWS